MGALEFQATIFEDDFCRLYEAREGDRQWLVKEILLDETAEIRQGLESEQKVLSLLSHRSVVARRHYQFEEDRVLLIQEHVRGVVLQNKLLESQEPVPHDAVVELALQLTDALTYLHEHEPPVIVSLIDPSAVIVTERGEVKLLHFGLAKLGYRTGRKYEAPEHARPEPVGHRADIYGVGVIMHQLLTKIDLAEVYGEMPAIARLLPDIDTDLANIVSRSTTLDPKRRYQKARSLRTRLSRLLDKWKLARPDGRKLLAEWAGFEAVVPPTPEPQPQLPVPEIEEDSLEDFIAAIRPAEPPPLFSGAFKVAACLVVVGGLFFLRDGYDMVDTLYYFLVAVAAFVVWAAS